MYKHKSTIKVRYAETDRMGVTYYANYFVWFEVARTEYMRSRGVSYRDIEEAAGVYMMVKEASCVYMAPTTYDDDVTVLTWVSEIRNVSIVFNYEVSVGEKRVAEGKSVHVVTDRNKKPVKIPEILKKALV